MNSPITRESILNSLEIAISESDNVTGLLEDLKEDLKEYQPAGQFPDEVVAAMEKLGFVQRANFIATDEKAVIENLPDVKLKKVEAEPKKRKRRTKAEIEADKAPKEESPIVEEEIIKPEEKPASKKKAPKKDKGLKPDDNVPVAPEGDDISIADVRNYAGAFTRYLDNGVEFHDAVNKAFDKADMDEFILMDDEDAADALKVIKAVIAIFLKDQGIADKNEFGDK